MTSPAPVIHVVDDDASFRTAIARLLRASGYQVALYESGERLLESPPRGEPGCILLDLRMDGIEASICRTASQSWDTRCLSSS